MWLLKSDPFCTAVNDFWPKWQLEKPLFTDPRVWWDAGKLQLKEIAVARGIQSACNRKHARASLHTELHNLQSRGDSNNAAHQTRLIELKTLLTAMDDEQVEGAIVRSKEQWVELGERPSWYFFPT